MNSFDYLHSPDGCVHVINARKSGSTLSAGILCCVAQVESKCRIADENNSFLIELPDGVFAQGSQVKVFNVDLAILKDEQVQLPPSN